MALGLLFMACTPRSSIKNDAVEKSNLNQATKVALIQELTNRMKADQLQRSYLSYGTFDTLLIDSVKSLPLEEMIQFQTAHNSDLSKAQEDSLWKIQLKMDLENTNRLYDIIKEFGWLSESDLDSLVNPMIFLFHTPKETIGKMQEALLDEVKAKRMQPLSYATYVDNMRKKAFGKNQLYGTGEEYDIETQSILPPIIDNIDTTNMERMKIGLPKLKEGEFRTPHN